MLEVNLPEMNSLNDFLQALDLILRIVTTIAIALAAYWSRKDLTATRRVRHQLDKLPADVARTVQNGATPLPPVNGQQKGD